MKVLITGFDPFGGESINPALEAVKMIPENIEGAQVIKLEIPTVFRKSLEKIEEKIEEINPSWRKVWCNSRKSSYKYG